VFVEPGGRQVTAAENRRAVEDAVAELVDDSTARLDRALDDARAAGLTVEAGGDAFEEAGGPGGVAEIRHLDRRGRPARHLRFADLGSPAAASASWACANPPTPSAANSARRAASG
jgi:hypothetical protein